jgi:hypothetical protein
MTPDTSALMDFAPKRRPAEVNPAHLSLPVCGMPTFAGIVLLGFLLASSAHAADGLEPSLCQAVVRHTPRADVTYQPGVDVNGNAVEPADVPGSPQMQLPNKIEFPVTVSLARVLNLDTTKFPKTQIGPGTEAWLGTLSVEGNDATFNGKPLTDAQQSNLSVLCMKQTGAKP